MRFVSDRGWIFLVQAAGRAGTGFFGAKSSCCVVVTGLLSGAHLVISTPASLSAASFPTHVRLVAQFLVMVRLSAPALAERPRERLESPAKTLAGCLGSRAWRKPGLRADADCASLPAIVSSRDISGSQAAKRSLRPQPETAPGRRPENRGPTRREPSNGK